LAQETKRIIRAPQDMAAALFLIGLGAFALWQNAGLERGTLRVFGPGMMPTILAWACIIAGFAVGIGAMLWDGPKLERWTFRGPLFILGSAVAFGLTVRPLGMVIAAPLAIMLSSMASSETKLGEAAIFAVVITAFCLGLFRFTLNLPIPVAPWAIGY
jgi:putative tricarboxylic transport membrane protein